MKKIRVFLDWNGTFDNRVAGFGDEESSRYSDYDPFSSRPVIFTALDRLQKQMDAVAEVFIVTGTTYECIYEAVEMYNIVAKAHGFPDLFKYIVCQNHQEIYKVGDGNPIFIDKEYGKNKQRGVENMIGVLPKEEVPLYIMGGDSKEKDLPMMDADVGEAPKVFVSPANGDISEGSLEYCESKPIFKSRYNNFQGIGNTMVLASKTLALSQ